MFLLLLLIHLYAVVLKIMLENTCRLIGRIWYKERETGVKKAFMNLHLARKKTYRHGYSPTNANIFEI